MSQEHRDHPVDVFLRRVLPAEEPTLADLDRAADTFARKVAEPKPRSFGVWLKAAASVAVVAVGIVLLQTGGASPAEAALSEVAEAARLLDPLQVRSGEFVYTRSESTNLITEEDAAGPIYAHVSELRETWADGAGFLQVRTTIGVPVFFDSDMERRYYEAGFDAHRPPGEIMEQFENVGSMLDELDWPTEPAALADTLRGLGENGSDDEVFSFALSLLREDFASPQLRAGLVEVIGGLGVEIIHRAEDSITIAREILRGAGRRDRYSVTISDEAVLTFQRLEYTDEIPDLGLPAGILSSEWTLLERSIVNGLD